MTFARCAWILFAATILVACSSDGDWEESPEGDSCDTGCQTTDTPASRDAELVLPVAESLALGCDVLDPNYCHFPFPNNFFTQEDSATDTGLRVDLNIAGMPRNAANKPLDPTEWNRNDGFSPGALIEARIVGLSMDDAVYAQGGRVVPHITAMHRSLEPRSNVVVIDATPTLPGTAMPNPLFGKQHLVWAELDANTTAATACSAVGAVGVLGDLGGIQELEDFAAAVQEQCAGLPDAQNSDPLNDPGPALLIHPGVNLEEGHRYIVALVGLRDGSGALIPPSAAFQVYRDKIPSAIPMIEDRRADMEEIFTLLAESQADAPRSELTLAWDFTVASERNLTERVLHMRNVAFANYLPDVGGVPEFTIDTVENYPLDGDDCLGNAADESDPGRGDRNTENCIARRITGSVTVPSFMTLYRTEQLPANPLTDQSPISVEQYVGGRLYYDPADGDELPDVNPLTTTETFPFTCNIPRSAFAGAPDPTQATQVVPTRISLYGHGLLGSQGEGRNQAQLKRFANEHNFSFCMTDWIGMSHFDIANVATVLVDMSNFPTLADRAQQGFLNKMFLARLMVDPSGFSANPAFRQNDSALFDTSQGVFYDGNSQGGIMGGALVAISPDIHRGSLGVVGMNYSTLLSRSTDFAPYGAIFYNAYPESLDQQFVFSLIQMLWDRAENNGYAQHLGDGETRNPRVGLANTPLPDLPTGNYDEALGPFDGAIGRMPTKEILLHPAFGDHQVTHWSAEVMARTIGVNGADVYFRPPEDQGSADGTVIHTYASKADYLAMRAPDEMDFFAMGDIDYADTAIIEGSALVMWDEGRTDIPPLNNTYPNTDPYDPHEYPRRTVAARCQKARFLRPDGRVISTANLNNANTVACPRADGVGRAFAD